MVGRADVVCLQETNGLEPGFLTRLKQELPGYGLVRSREVAILTRFPVRAQRNTLLPATERTLLTAVLDVNGQAVTVLDAHFTTILLRGGWREMRASREAQLQSVLRVARDMRGLLVLCGDFNAPTRDLVYGQLKRTFRNAFDDAGAGFGYTFPANVPLVRIDHVWLRELDAVRAQVLQGRASDHRPLVVDIAVP